jgi:hypothetical protein
MTVCLKILHGKTFACPRVEYKMRQYSGRLTCSVPQTLVALTDSDLYTHNMEQ